MSKLRLTAIRQNEDWILNDEPKVYINGQITQYLLSHQISGIRFLYDNYKKKKSTILNDENGSGKCFQCVTFLDAILNCSKNAHILILCQSKENLAHWRYHIDNLLETIHAKIADNQNDSQRSGSSDNITIASIDHVLSSLPEFKTQKFDCLIVQDKHLQITSETFTRLKEIQTTHKIVLCSNDLIDALDYFYELLKFCEQTGPLVSTRPSQQLLSLDEFKQKYGYSDDKSIPKRQQVFRQKNLMNACNTFYMRRLCNQLGSQYPSINAKHFQSDFSDWKANVYDTQPVESNAFVDDDSSPIELLPNPINKSLVSVASEEVSILNVACTDFSDFDTQMSPLIYSDSDESIHCDNDSQINLQNSQNAISSSLTPEIACNQEHAARARNSTKESSSSTSSARIVTPTKRKSSDLFEKVSPASKRLNYRQLPIKISSNGTKSDSKPETNLFRKRKQTCSSSVESDNNSMQNSSKTNRRMAYSRSTSSTSDVQIISDHASIITISSSEEQPLSDSKNEKETEFDTSTGTGTVTHCPSPDLFNSFISVKSEPATQTKSSTPSSQDKQQDATENTFTAVFGPPDECDDIDLYSKNGDIFEITKNSVFDNVLCSANDRITPFKGTSTQNLKASANTSCLSGLKIKLPIFDGHRVAEIQNDILAELQSSQKSSSTDDSVVDLTLNESQNIIIEVSSDDSNRNREKTPERKLDLTPSTRSCLKPNSSIEKRKRSSYVRHGWLSTSRTSPQSTPQSRRRLDRWRKRLNELHPDENVKVTKPRKLFDEFKSNAKSSQRIRQKNLPSTSTHESPNIFSDHD